MTNDKQRQTANGLSKGVAIGLAAISWPTISLLELVLLKKLVPELFRLTLQGPAVVVEAQTREHDLKMWTAVILAVLVALVISVLLGLFLYGNGKGLTAKRNEGKSDA